MQNVDQKRGWIFYTVLQLVCKNALLSTFYGKEFFSCVDMNLVDSVGEQNWTFFLFSNGLACHFQWNHTSLDFFFLSIIQSIAKANLVFAQLLDFYLEHNFWLSWLKIFAATEISLVECRLMKESQALFDEQYFMLKKISFDDLSFLFYFKIFIPLF